MLVKPTSFPFDRLSTVEVQWAFSGVGMVIPKGAPKLKRCSCGGWPEYVGVVTLPGGEMKDAVQCPKCGARTRPYKAGRRLPDDVMSEGRSGPE
jgi:hypothetical protein